VCEFERSHTPRLKNKTGKAARCGFACSFQDLDWSIFTLAGNTGSGSSAARIRSVSPFPPDMLARADVVIE
jgi:hypothetical protein